MVKVKEREKQGATSPERWGVIEQHPPLMKTTYCICWSCLRRVGWDWWMGRRRSKGRAVTGKGILSLVSAASLGAMIVRVSEKNIYGALQQRRSILEARGVFLLSQ